MTSLATLQSIIGIGESETLELKLSTAERFEDFLTVPAYDVLLAAEPVNAA